MTTHPQLHAARTLWIENSNRWVVHVASRSNARCSNTSPGSIASTTHDHAGGGIFACQLVQGKTATDSDERAGVMRNLSTPRSLLGLLRLDSDAAGASAANSPACGSTPQQLRESRLLAVFCDVKQHCAAFTTPCSDCCDWHRALRPLIAQLI